MMGIECVTECESWLAYTVLVISLPSNIAPSASSILAQPGMEVLHRALRLVYGHGAKLGSVSLPLQGVFWSAQPVD